MKVTHNMPIEGSRPSNKYASDVASVLEALSRPSTIGCHVQAPRVAQAKRGKKEPPHLLQYGEIRAREAVPN